MRYFLDIAYKGTAYSGWQIQNNAPTVQEKINQSFEQIFKQKIPTMGSGRTDTGVHALQQVMHFDLHSPITNPSHFLYKLNAFLPKDIVAQRVRSVRDDAHARYDAIKRSYRYVIYTSKNPFACGDGYYYFKKVDLTLIQRAIGEIIKQEDFECFSRVKTQVNHFKCQIFDCKFSKIDSGLEMYISANRFLRGMVRTIVGTLLQVGNGNMSIEKLIEVLESKDRKKAGAAVPAEGLYLCEVMYPPHIFI